MKLLRRFRADRAARREAIAALLDEAEQLGAECLFDMLRFRRDVLIALPIPREGRADEATATRFVENIARSASSFALDLHKMDELIREAAPYGIHDRFPRPVAYFVRTLISDACLIAALETPSAIALQYCERWLDRSAALMEPYAADVKRWLAEHGFELDVAAALRPNAAHSGFSG